MTAKNAAAINALATEITLGIRRLSLLARATDDLGGMVAVLEALEGADGPLAELGDLLTDGAEWLAGFEHDDTASAGERMEETSGQNEAVREGLDLALRLMRPLAD